jgi:hypothetical protein
MNIAVLLLLYKRPETTVHVINALKKVKPKFIYISLNIPTASASHEDHENYKKVLKLVREINWKCDLKIKKRKKHLSSYNSYKSAIKWFFENEKEGIILEDDTVPNKSFFIFCKKLLKKYKNNKQIAQICGTSFVNRKKIINENYIFSNYSLGWGYATWRRSVNDYDEKMKGWLEIKRKKSLLKTINDKGFLYFWTKKFDVQYKNNLKHWDERWLYSNWKNNKLSIIPKKHLVKNIGIGASATHTKTKQWYSNLETHEMQYKDKHPKKIFANLEYDKWLNINVFGTNFLYIRQKIIKNKIIKNKLIFSMIKLVYKIVKPFYRLKKPSY